MSKKVVIIILALALCVSFFVRSNETVNAFHVQSSGVKM